MPDHFGISDEGSDIWSSAKTPDSISRSTSSGGKASVATALNCFLDPDFVLTNATISSLQPVISTGPSLLHFGHIYSASFSAPDCRGLKFLRDFIDRNRLCIGLVLNEKREVPSSFLR